MSQILVLSILSKAIAIGLGVFFLLFGFVFNLVWLTTVCLFFHIYYSNIFSALAILKCVFTLANLFKIHIFFFSSLTVFLNTSS